MRVEIDVQRRLGQTDIDVQFAGQSGVTALFGPSGAGKSSVINMIAGLLRPKRGRIVVDDRILFDSARRINVPAHKRRVGYVFQESRLFPHMSVRRNLLYGQRFSAPERRYTQLDRVADLLGIAALLQRRPHMLSGGERQRVAIGRALLASPSLLLMDEPLASLDAARKNEILPYIERLRDELALPVIYVSHQFDEVKRLADMLVMMADGRCIAAGTVNQILARPDLAPLTGHAQTGCVIDTRIARHDERFALTWLRCAAGELAVPRVERPVGASLRVHVHADDVVIALDRPTGLSTQNMLPATIVSIDEGHGHHHALELDAAGITLVAHVTRKAAHDLSLDVGSQVHALFKSLAIDDEPPHADTDATCHETGIELS
ncbi:MAG TPA: molybdenum ABC transporter ATP-binding protein [Oleiagrimonas sp.]|nr:molybdenum ABC transporter ATP-binding protein [Oleiagrimonas sp.]